METEYRKSYKGLVLWLVGYTALSLAPALLPEGTDPGIEIRLVLALTAAAVAGLMAIIWKTESVYWINGTSFEQARDAGSDRRREFAAAHLRVFGRFALGYVVFSAIMQWRGVTWGVDLAVFCVGLIGAAIGTLKVKL